MTKRNVILVILSFVVVSAAVLCAIVSLGKSGTPSPKLKIVRRGLEKGRPIVFCSVEGGGGRRMMIRSVEQFVGEKREMPMCLRRQDFCHMNLGEADWNSVF